MIEDIQSRVLREQKTCCYNYMYGYQVIFRDKLLQKYYFPCNHYSTYVEENKIYLQTILYWNHIYLDRFTNYKEILCEPMWIELVHDLNVANRTGFHRLNKFLFSSAQIKQYPMLYGFRVSKFNTIKQIIEFSIPVRVLKRLGRMIHK
jgi:hypothetical protein